MRSYLIFIPIFLLALLQGVILPFNLVLLVVLVWAAIRPAKESLIVAFFSGIFLDLASGTPLGISSFAFCLLSFTFYLYSRRFDPSRPAFLSIFVFLSANLYSLITNRLFNWQPAMILAFLAFLTRSVIEFYQEEISQDKLKLSL